MEKDFSRKTFTWILIFITILILPTTSSAKDFWDMLEPGIGKFRECRQTTNCQQNRNCSQSNDCRQTENCNRCLVRNPFGGCSIRGNDPICEARKVGRKGECERLKSTRKAACEVEKSSAKTQCEASKEAKRVDCERLKGTQISTSEITELAIHESKRQMSRTHLRPVPATIMNQLGSFFAKGMLDRVRYTTEYRNVLSLSEYSLDWLDKSAIVFGDIVVFKSVNDALNNVCLWAHELEHVKQYDRLGIDGFAQYYTHANNRIEAAAEAQGDHVCK